MADDVIAMSPSAEQRKSASRKPAIDMVGRVFSRLTVIARAPNKIAKTGSSSAMWECRCQCGNVVVVFAGNLTRGHTGSCGCFRQETVRKNVGKNHPQFSHGKSGSPEYKSWNGARGRVTEKSNHKYPLYGGRGIGMCSRWLNNFEAFLQDMGPRPPGTTLDRIDNDGWYSPSNCRWSTPKTQSRNRRSCMSIKIDGLSKTAVEWSEISGIDASTIRQRLRLLGWDAKKAVFAPSRQKKKQRARQGTLL